jgi:hyperosmotically inducible protein
MKPKSSLLAVVAAAATLALAACATDTQRSAGQVIQDQAIETHVKAALIDAPDVAAGKVEVETYKGVVQLTGVVASQKEADAAAAAAKKVPGVVSVKNELRVQPR